ncbi:helix-turn-helix domain-containing protein [Micromonospora olivasterospora]|uniref:helix-turn-helix domain-containing protein n=1 Tax=Micromonospora olivasterospora TaxID=1880 RepID=UPI001FE426CF|nr:helix-turn-helix domain-containing protein [Micromonospora olivasterospora]
MNVSQPRVAAIESGELPKAEVGTVARYIAALGGKAEFVAEFDGERVTLRARANRSDALPQIRGGHGHP